MTKKQTRNSEIHLVIPENPFAVLGFKNEEEFVKEQERVFNQVKEIDLFVGQGWPLVKDSQIVK